MNPYRAGYCDAVMGRECKSPWSNLGYTAAGRNRAYVNGYIDGKEVCKKMGIEHKEIKKEIFA